MLLRSFSWSSVGMLYLYICMYSFHSWVFNYGIDIVRHIRNHINHEALLNTSKSMPSLAKHIKVWLEFHLIIGLGN